MLYVTNQSVQFDRRMQVSTTGAVVLLLMLAAAGARADSPDAGGLDEILVTAQRRSENLQTVPIAITALSGQAMAEGGVHDLGTLASYVPGLTFSPFSQDQNILSIRGVSSNDGGAGTDSSVTVFVDDVYLGRIADVNPEMFDVERVEVLRGPQGTLYGQNSIGGTINVISTRPDTQNLEVHAHAEFGNYNRHNFAGLISGPVSDTWALKMAVATRHAEGWVNNVALGTREKDDNDVAVRTQALRTAGDSEVLVGVDYQRLAVGDQARIPLTQVTGNLGPLVSDYERVCGDEGPSCAANPTDGFARRESGGVTVKATETFGASQLVSISAFRRFDLNLATDAIGIDLPFSARVSDHEHQYSEELRWLSTLGSAVNYVAGLWLLRENTDRFEAYVLEPTPVDDSDRYDQNNHTTSAAAFADGGWRFAPDWKLSIGARYSFDHKAITNDSTHGNFVVINQDFFNKRSASWDGFTPKISLEYQPREAVNLYAVFAQGFKSGGFAAAPVRVEDTNPLKPEKATNLEVGMKADLSNRVRINAAIFHTRYRDLQIQSFGPPPGCVQAPNQPNACFGAFETFNAGDAVARGAEVEAFWLPTDRISLSLSHGYLDAKFITLVLPNADYPIQGGHDMFRAPRNKAHLELKYLMPLNGGGKLEAQSAYSYTSNQRAEVEPYAIQPAFGLLDARIAWTNPSGRLEVALRGSNLTDRAWVSHVYTIAGEAIAAFGDPRTYGVTFDWRY